VALLGWSPGGEREIYSLDELKEIFDLKGISKSPAIFDLEKLKYFNAEYIRSMSPEKFAEVAEPFIRQAVKNPAIDPAAIAALLQQRTEILTDIPAKLDFFDELPEYDASLFVHQKSKSTVESAKTVLTDILPMLEGLPEWKDEEILAAMTELTERMCVKKSVVMWPIRIAAAGKAVTPGGAVEICRILGREETLRRLQIGLDKLA
ncbi:MAG: glutamate--tRNA ligase, partial [Oscillospiraceae bacterium]|nr:glutamate--tRNA ligase [Oscillospiraceae bacterium]